MSNYFLKTVWGKLAEPNSFELNFRFRIKNGVFIIHFEVLSFNLFYIFYQPTLLLPVNAS